MYTKEHFQSDMVFGLFNGSLFALCWGITNGSYQCYQPDLTKKKYLKSIGNYTLKQNLQIVPIFCFAKTFHNYLKQNQYKPEISAVLTLSLTVIGIGFFEVMVKKFKI